MSNSKKSIKVDLSLQATSFTSHLLPHIPTIDKKNYEEILDIIRSAKGKTGISDGYIEQVLSQMESKKHNPRMVRKYVADIYLAGAGLAVI